MYKNGEIEDVMNRFESALSDSPIYHSGNFERADKVEIQTFDGRISKRYIYNNYYNNGNVNDMFMMYLHGYAFGKAKYQAEH